MSPLRSAAIASALILMGGSAAWAQTAQGNTNSGTQSEWGQSSPGAKVTADTLQKIRQSLEESGFKDVRVIPESFVVRAEAPDGSPMRGWVADATRNGEQVHALVSDNGLVATFPGR